MWYSVRMDANVKKAALAVNGSYISLDTIVFEALANINHLRALHGKKAWTLQDFLKAYRPGIRLNIEP